VRTEIFALCEAAEQLQGKLTFIGVFDTVVAQAVPLDYGPFAVVARVRFERLEAGEHHVEIHLLDEDGRQKYTLFDGSVRISVKPGPGSAGVATMNLTHTIGSMAFPAFGGYDVNLLVDDNQIATVPLAIRRIA
jgi:hypothetical protein